jgi:large subunit ribosomal protein L35
MPKMKTHKGAAKRFKVTAGGKIKRTHCNKNHILNKKERKRKRNLRHAGFVNKANKRTIEKQLPYAS